MAIFQHDSVDYFYEPCYVVAFCNVACFVGTEKEEEEKRKKKKKENKSP